MATRTIANGGGNWNSTGTWVEGAVPTASDDVVATSTSGQLTINVAAACRSIDLTNYTNTLTHAAGVTLSVGTSTINPSNVALKFVSGMTYTLGSTTTSIISFVSTSATQQSITTGGKTIGQMTFNGVGGSWQLQDSFTQNSASTITFTNGSVDTNGQTCSWGIVALGAGTKTLSLGASTVTIIGSTLNFTTNQTNFTFNAGTSSIVFTPSASVTPTWNTGTSITYYNVSITKSSGGFNITLPAAGTVTFNNLTQDNTVLGGGNRVMQFTGGSTININGVLTYIANNASSARGLLQSATGGSIVTINLGTTGSAALTDIDLSDITFTGTSTPVVATAGRLGDCGGNSGVTTQTPTTFYYIGNGLSFSSTTAWSLSSGGSSAGMVPLPQDTTIFDANSFTSSNVTVNNGQMRMGTIDFSQVTNSPNYNPTNPNGAGNRIFGSLILNASMGYTCTGAAGGSTTHSFRGRSNYVINFAGLSNPSNVGTDISAPNGTYTLQSDFIASNSGGFAVNNGTFSANGFNVTTVSFNSSNSNARAINMGSGNWTLTGTGTVWNYATTTNATLNVGTATIVVSDTSSSNKTLIFGGTVIPNVTTSGGPGAVIFSNSGTRNCGTFILAPGTTMTFSANATYNIVDLIALGTAANPITINSTTPGTQATLNHNESLIKFIVHVLAAALSFVGTFGPKTVARLLAASLSFTGSIKRAIGRALSAALSFTGSFLASAVKLLNLSAALSFTGSIAKRVQRSVIGVLSFTGSIAKRAQKAVNGALSFTASILAASPVAIIFTATLSFTGSATKATRRSLAAGLSFAGKLAKSVAHALSGALSFAGNLATSLTGIFSQSFSAALSFTGSMTRQTSSTLSGALSFTGSIAKRTARTVSAVLSFMGNLSVTKTLLIALSAALSFTGSTTKQARRSLNAAVSFVGALLTARHLVVVFQAALSFTGVLARSTAKSLSAQLSLAGSLSRSIAKTLTAALNLIVTFTAFLKPVFVPIRTVIKSSIKTFTDTSSSKTDTIASSDTIESATSSTKDDDISSTSTDTTVKSSDTEVDL